MEMDGYRSLNFMSVTSNGTLKGRNTGKPTDAVTVAEKEEIQGVEEMQGIECEVGEGGSRIIRGDLQTTRPAVGGRKAAVLVPTDHGRHQNPQARPGPKIHHPNQVGTVDLDPVDLE